MSHTFKKTLCSFLMIASAAGAMATPSFAAAHRAAPVGPKKSVTKTTHGGKRSTPSKSARKRPSRGTHKGRKPGKVNPAPASNVKQG